MAMITTALIVVWLGARSRGVGQEFIMSERCMREIVACFNESISDADLHGLTSMLTEGHVFIDSLGRRIVGRAGAGRLGKLLSCVSGISQ